MARAMLFLLTAILIFALCLVLVATPPYSYGRDVEWIIGLSEGFDQKCINAPILGGYTDLEEHLIMLGRYHGLTEHGYLPQINGQTVSSVSWDELLLIEQYCKVQYPLS